MGWAGLDVGNFHAIGALVGLRKVSGLVDERSNVI